MSLDQLSFQLISLTCCTRCHEHEKGLKSSFWWVFARKVLFSAFFTTKSGLGFLPSYIQNVKRNEGERDVCGWSFYSCFLDSLHCYSV